MAGSTARQHAREALGSGDARPQAPMRVSVWAAMSIALAIAVVWAAPARVSGDLVPPIAPERFVAVSDLIVRPWPGRFPGCGAVSVVDTADSAVVMRESIDIVDGVDKRPSRLAATTDVHLIVSTAFARQEVQVLAWDVDQERWAKGPWLFDERFGRSAAAAISPDDTTLLVSGLNSVLKYDVANVTLESLGPLQGHANLGDRPQARYHETMAATIVFTSDSRTAYVVDQDFVQVLDVASMTWQRSPIPYPATHGEEDYRVSRTFATLSPDERLLVINRGLAGGIGKLSFLSTLTGVLSEVETPELGETWGVAFNYVGDDRGLLAVHGRSEVAVYRPTDGGLVQIAVTPIPPPSERYFGFIWEAQPWLARFGALAWSGDGQRVIANRGFPGLREWRVLELSEGPPRRLEVVSDFDSCTSTEELLTTLKSSMGYDVLTIQRRPTLTATPPPTASATATTTPSPTSTATRTRRPTVTAAAPRPSRTPGASPTATATHAATAAPLPVYLPVALRERCVPVHERADIALVIDTSSSMTGRKIDDARDAALSFIGMIDLEPGRSQVAIVRFDREAEVVRELTNVRALVDAAIRNLQVRSGTHIDKGLRIALGELESPRHLERNAQVLILLTDGVQTGTPGEELRAGDEVRAAGVRVYTIGLGADVDEATLRTIAGADDHYYFAPDSGDLARIYGEIARDLMCPGVELWGGR